MIQSYRQVTEVLSIDGQAKRDLQTALENLRDYFKDAPGEFPEAVVRADALDHIIKHIAEKQYITIEGSGDGDGGVGRSFSTMAERREMLGD